MDATEIRRFFGFIALRNLFLSVVIGGLTGLIVSSVSPTKRGTTMDIVLGMVGAFLGSVFLTLLRGGVPKVAVFGVLFAQIIGALVLILFARLLGGGEK